MIKVISRKPYYTFLGVRCSLVKFCFDDATLLDSVDLLASVNEGSAPGVRQTTLRSNQSGTSLSLKRGSAIWDAGELVDVFSGRKNGMKQTARRRPQSVHLRDDCGRDTEPSAVNSRPSGLHFGLEIFVFWLSSTLALFT